jgi:uncharacterized ubiquitin-like protein YukD
MAFPVKMKMKKMRRRRGETIRTTTQGQLHSTNQLLSQCQRAQQTPSTATMTA